MIFRDGLELYIARRIAFKKSSAACDVDVRSDIMSGVAMWSVAISVVVMLFAGFVVDGFRVVVGDKVKGLIADYSIVPYNPNHDFFGFDANTPFVSELRNNKNIMSVSPYIQKNGVVKSEKGMSGLVLKGVALDDFITSFYGKHLLSGRLPVITENEDEIKEVIISKKIASDLGAKVGDKVEFMFLEQTPMRDRYIVSGIFDTSIDIIDASMAVTNISNMEELTGWGSGRVDGFEVRVKDNIDGQQGFNTVSDIIDRYKQDNEGVILVSDVKRNYPQIFSWLDLQKTNETVILTIMMIVSVVNMIAMSLILLMRNIPMIGSLQVMGATNGMIRKIFLYRFLFIILKGIVIGIVVAIILGLLQKYFGIIKLDGKGYFVNSVPIYISAIKLIGVVFGTIAVMLLSQWWATSIVSSINPSVSVKYDNK